jgi:hypothetical protein
MGEPIAFGFYRDCLRDLTNCGYRQSIISDFLGFGWFASILARKRSQ